MHVELQIDVERAPRLVVPAAAVLYAGARRIVFIDLGHGRYEPRPVTLGAQANGFVEVLDRLTESDRVVVRGTFLLAAESRIRSDGALWSDRKDPPIRRTERSKP
jgi:membrane fusion protein, copper/silver efflux system